MVDFDHVENQPVAVKTTTTTKYNTKHWKEWLVDLKMLVDTVPDDSTIDCHSNSIDYCFD